MFGLFKKKKEQPKEEPKVSPNFASVKSEITLKHSGGNTIKITIEGISNEHVTYVSNRIKETFNMKAPNHSFNKNMDKFWANIDKNWEKQEGIFDSIFKEFDKKK